MPYLSFLPCGALALITIILQYRRTGEAHVGWRQALITLWIAATAAMTWFVLFDAPDLLVSGHGCVIYLCGLAGNVGILLGVVLWGLALILTTVAYPASFMFVNFYQGWHTSALCGLCGLGFEITVLANFGVDNAAWPSWFLHVGSHGRRYRMRAYNAHVACTRPC